MKKTRMNIYRVSLSLAMAAVIAASGAGCSRNGAHTSTAPSDAPQATTVTAAIPAPSSGETGTESNNADTSSPAESGATSGTTAAETAEAADTDRTTAADIADTSSTAAAAADTASTAETAADVASTGDTAAAAGTSSTAETAAENSTDAPAEDSVAAALEDGVPARSTPDTALKESVLSKALVSCTGWGQSAGSSLRAASAAVQLLIWANEVEAGSVDSSLLKDTVKAEFKLLSDAQQENLKENWSSVSYDASMVLDDFEEISPLMEDAGCSAAAKEASKNKNAVKNWEALEHALNAVLK